MSSDLPDGNESTRGTGGRTPRLGDARSPVGSTLSIVLAVVAVVAGFLILRELTDDDGNGATDIGTDDSGAVVTVPGADNGTDTATEETSVLVDDGTSPPPAADAAPTYAGATIAVANASGVDGSALQMSTALTTEGYQGVGDPGNGSGEDQDTSVIYYVAGDAAAQAVAQSIAADFGGVAAEAMPAERPASGGITETATVLIMLGRDAAGQSLSELSATNVTSPATGDTTDTTAP